MSRVAVKLVFADRGAFHDFVVQLPSDVLARHDRIIDALREEPAITAEIYVDLRRLVAAHLLAGGEEK
ncbi:MAG: hypothetical protein ACT443_00320 [Gemmatimonadota bacterium]